MGEPKSIGRDLLISRAHNNWQTWGLQGHGFLKGAKRYVEDGNYRLAAFLLHQAVESTLTGITKMLLGYRLTIHNHFIKFFLQTVYGKF
jgi:HEPN domain-containing protein